MFVYRQIASRKKRVVAATCGSRWYVLVRAIYDLPSTCSYRPLTNRLPHSSASQEPIDESSFTSYLINTNRTTNQTPPSYPSASNCDPISHLLLVTRYLLLLASDKQYVTSDVWQALLGRRANVHMANADNMTPLDVAHWSVDERMERLFGDSCLSTVETAM